MKTETGYICGLFVMFVAVVVIGIVVLGVGANYCDAGLWTGWICEVMP